jgi:hypothetical protein
MQLLHDVQLESSKNLMSAHNLTIVWAPNMVRSENPMEDFAICAAGNGGHGGAASATAIASGNGNGVVASGESASTSSSAAAAVNPQEDVGVVGGGVGVIVKLGILRWGEMFDGVLVGSAGKSNTMGGAIGEGEEAQQA